ncbi:MAG: hypothetical protein WA896_16375 [Spirulinaceae cyanobacterium]
MLRQLPSQRLYCIALAISGDVYYVSAWDGWDFYPRGNPLNNLSSEQKTRLQEEYKKAIAELVTEQGVWQDSTTLYVKARK